MTNAPHLKLVTLHESNYRDPVAELRAIADLIEQGHYGPIGCIGLVVLGDRMEVFGMGEDSEAPSVALLLHAGFMRMSRTIEEHGED